jgi:hypothetical protein
MMRKILFAATWGIVFLFGADHASAEHLSSPFSKLKTSTVLALRLRMVQPNREPKKLNPSLTAALRTWRYPNDCSP